MRLSKFRNLGNDLVNIKLQMESEYLQQLQKVIESKNDVVTFLHNTKSKETAELIVKEGFEFQSHLDYTSDVVSAKDPVTIKYFTIVRQAYGNYTMVIQIGKDLIEDYSEILETLPHHFSEALTVKEPYLGSEEDLIYCLAPNFVKGFIDSQTAEFHANPIFNPNLKSPLFEENLRRILKSQNKK
ncbi:MAG: hypothetical protein JEZ09_21465 [Salinivirgaceae bacterium]|nr:hypothetical protein [Salinivirgaceae bacterium]